ncbi:riboflavin kinase/FMN adenylyltransferase [Melghirimyces profundicolus]|uniref:Riboflavin biosynthesis protein n=1 Tax=Melghirimyces profundicolus TaxID=1242148 RepID=A0A2T6BRD2_9BACL|nr:bifunctional riboflavin kinase/FAD synthetase [Melghirimyces profundicolus]PTX58628.1 riboflavin kinase/FMN adenylyltransferase [Melghirimyces profundicolus]
METIHLSYPFKQKGSFPPVSLAIGYFDGVHRGHRTVIEKARRFATAIGTTPAVMTFHPHPREVLGKAEVTRYLTPLPEKLKRFEELGVDRVYVMRFDRELAARTKEQFVEEVLLPLEVKSVAVGYNFTFGRGAEGKAEDLARLGADRFRVEVVQPVRGNGGSFSSTRVREALGEGRVSEAAEILGRPYSLWGRVTVGDRRGRKIGFPTANLRLEEPFLVPATGVYIVRVKVGARIHHGMMNIGFRPTFDDPEPKKTLEVHLFDVNEDLYGFRMEVQFLRHLRNEVRFDSVESLIDQLKSDEREARDWLKNQNRF